MEAKEFQDGVYIVGDAEPGAIGAPIFAMIMDNGDLELARKMAAAPELLDAADYANGCFQAAFTEGWIEAIADGDLELIRDIWNRRLSMACDKIIPAMEKATKA